MLCNWHPAPRYFFQEIFVQVDEVAIVHGILQPAAESVQVRLGCLRIDLQPEVDVVIQVLLIVQPAKLVDVMSQGAADGIVLPGMFHGCDEFGKHKPVGSLL